MISGRTHYKAVPSLSDPNSSKAMDEILTTPTLCGRQDIRRSTDDAEKVTCSRCRRELYRQGKIK